MTDKEVQDLSKKKAHGMGIVDGGVYKKDSIFDAETQVLGFDNPNRFTESVEADESYTRLVALFDYKQAKRFMDLINAAYTSGTEIEDIEYMIKQAIK